MLTPRRRGQALPPQAERMKTGPGRLEMRKQKGVLLHITLTACWRKVRLPDHPSYYRSRYLQLQRFYPALEQKAGVRKWFFPARLPD